MDGAFLPSAGGGLFMARWLPRARPTASVLFVPPFAEEMNKSRAMMALAAREVALAGMQAVILDPRGTGDSAGEFRDVALDDWREDLDLAVRWLAGQGAPVVGLVGVRFGAILAMEVAGRLVEPPVIALWQPVATGQLQLAQFLRLRVAGGILAGKDVGEEAGESVGSLSERLRAGETLEVGGYELSPRLAAQLLPLDLRAAVPRAGARVRWLEIGSGDPPQLTRVATDCLTRWTDAGATADGAALAGDAFWNTVEVTTCPALATETARLFARSTGS